MEAGYASLLRDLGGDKMVFDDEVGPPGEDPPIKIVDATEDDNGEVDHAFFAKIPALSPQHLSTHLPKATGCAGRESGKHLKSPSRRSTHKFTEVSCPVAVERPFGALVHMDFIE